MSKPRACRAKRSVTSREFLSEPAGSLWAPLVPAGAGDPFLHGGLDEVSHSPHQCELFFPFHRTKWSASSCVSSSLTATGRTPSPSSQRSNGSRPHAWVSGGFLGPTLHCCFVIWGQEGSKHSKRRWACWRANRVDTGVRQVEIGIPPLLHDWTVWRTYIGDMDKGTHQHLIPSLSTFLLHITDCDDCPRPPSSRVESREGWDLHSHSPPSSPPRSSSSLRWNEQGTVTGQ